MFTEDREIRQIVDRYIERDYPEYERVGHDKFVQNVLDWFDCKFKTGLVIGQFPPEKYEAMEFEERQTHVRAYFMVLNIEIMKQTMTPDDICGLFHRWFETGELLH